VKGATTVKVIYLQDLENVKNQLDSPLVLAIGYFDGIHLGHQKVISTAKDLAKKYGFKSAVMTFDPAPKAVLSKNPDAIKYITLLEDKIEVIRNIGIDYLFIVPFTKEFASLSPETFVDDYIRGLGVKHVVAGFDFTYGKFGKGNMETLESSSHGDYLVTTVGKIAKSNEKISSTSIREMIQSGKVEEVPHYLGRFYTMSGKVVHGKKLGRKLGFPTANIECSQKYVFPENGVYIVRLFVLNKWVNGVASIGYNPTINQDQTKKYLEVHIIDFDQEIYDEPVIVEWRKYIRPELKFDYLDDLIKQIHEDKVVAIDYFKKCGL